jgi:DNA-binding LacI/PurR family transcriptional regulator
MPSSPVIAIDHATALRGLLDHAYERGLEPGRDVLVASCSDAKVLAHTSPSVTAIDLSPRPLGAACASALLAHLINGASLVPLTLLPGTLHQRATTSDKLRPSGASTCPMSAGRQR